MPAPDETQDKTDGNEPEEPKQEPKAKKPSEPASEFEGKTAEEWAKTYKGLQRSFNDLKEKYDSLTSEKEKLATDLTDAKSFQGQVDTLQDTIAQVNDKLTAETSAKEKAQAGLDRATTIIKKYPGLAAWEAEGLLPQADDPDKLEELLGKFQSNLGKQVDSKLEEKISGASPEEILDGTKDDETDPINMSENSLWEKLIEIGKKKPFDQAEYDKVQAQYDAVLAKKQKKAQPAQ